MQVSYLHHRPTLTLHIFNARIFVLLVMAQLIRMLQSALHVRLLVTGVFIGWDKAEYKWIGNV